MKKMYYCKFNRKFNDMLILISPAKKLQTVKNADIKLTNIEFPEESKELISEIKKYSPQDLSSLMNISPKISDLNFERFVKWEFPFNSEDAGPALFMFNGDVYRGMQASTFTEDEISLAQNHALQTRNGDKITNLQRKKSL